MSPGGPTVLDRFCRLVLMRSDGNRQAIRALDDARLPGHLIGVLRMELDSLVRVLYLIETTDRERREHLMRATLDASKWPVTDATMVKVAVKQHEWARSVYKAGCAFIHLSANHDMSERDPFKALPAGEQADVLRYLRSYHGGPPGADVTFADVVEYLPRVLDKIASNLRDHVDELRAKHGD